MPNLLDKGDFKDIDDGFLKQSLNVLQKLADVQIQYNKLDTDRFINEVRNSIVAKYLSYTQINTEKHGFDARRESSRSDCECDYLEAKAASFDAKSLQATFNDTTLEKAVLFQRKNVYLALSVWRAASDLLFIVYGQNADIGKFLEAGVNRFKDGKRVRSTQSIDLSNLVFKYGFKIYTINKSGEEIYRLLRAHKGCRKIPRCSIYSIKELRQLGA